MTKKDDAKHRARYTLEFKLEAVRLVKAGQEASVTARVLGMPKATLSNWVRASEKRSGAANLNSAIGGNSGRQVGPRKAWREGVFEGQEISAPYPAHPQSGVQGTGGTGRLA